MRNDRGYVISGNITRSYYMHWKPRTLTYRSISHACQLPTTCCARGNPHQLEILRHSMFSLMEKLSVLLPEQTEEELLQVVIFKMVLSGYLHICIQPGAKKNAVLWHGNDAWLASSEEVAAPLCTPQAHWLGTTRHDSGLSDSAAVKAAGHMPVPKACHSAPYVAIQKECMWSTW